MDVFRKLGEQLDARWRQHDYDPRVFPELANALLEGRDLSEALRRGAAAAAIVVAKRGCASAMPDRADLESFLASRQMTCEPTKVVAE